jgi:hypothetical protein
MKSYIRYYLLCCARRQTETDSQNLGTPSHLALHGELEETLWKSLTQLFSYIFLFPSQRTFHICNGIRDQQYSYPRIFAISIADLQEEAAAEPRLIR